MVSFSEGFMEKLMLVKEMDGIVDFSKSSVQLDILIFLGLRGPASIDEISKSLGYKRRTVTDALRKMYNKGLIERQLNNNVELIILSNYGKKYINYLQNALNWDNSLNNSKNLFKHIRINNLQSAINMYYVIQAILYLGFSKNKEASLYELSKIINISPQRLKDYLDLYTDNPNLKFRFFNKIYKIKDSGTLTYKQIYYRLTNRGFEVFYNLPEYAKIRENKTLRLLMYLTKSNTPKTTLKRIVLSIIIGNSVLYLLLILKINIIPFIGWIIVTMILALLFLSIR